MNRYECNVSLPNSDLFSSTTMVIDVPEETSPAYAVDRYLRSKIMERLTVRISKDNGPVPGIGDIYPFSVFNGIIHRYEVSVETREGFSLGIVPVDGDLSIRNSIGEIRVQLAQILNVRINQIVDPSGRVLPPPGRTQGQDFVFGLDSANLRLDGVESLKKDLSEHPAWAEAQDVSHASDVTEGATEMKF